MHGRPDPEAKAEPGRSVGWLVGLARFGGIDSVMIMMIFFNWGLHRRSLHPATRSTAPPPGAQLGPNSDEQHFRLQLSLHRVLGSLWDEVLRWVGPTGSWGGPTGAPHLIEDPCLQLYLDVCPVLVQTSDANAHMLPLGQLVLPLRQLVAWAGTTGCHTGRLVRAGATGCHGLSGNGDSDPQLLWSMAFLERNEGNDGKAQGSGAKKQKLTGKAKRQRVMPGITYFRHEFRLSASVGEEAGCIACRFFLGWRRGSFAC